MVAKDYQAVSDQLGDFLKRYGRGMEEALLQWLPLSDKPGTELFNQAVYYAVFPGGKRMRPFFTLLASEITGGDPEQAMPIACAIEYLHTCSLIFDDLPAMDNALERRGRQPTHMAFGEDVAILAGLAFLNQAYALVGRMDYLEKGKNKVQRLIAEFAACVGSEGMIGGQVADLRRRTTDDERLRPVSYLKTTALMRLMLMAGAISAEAKEPQIAALAEFGEKLGAAYQMLDDIVDEAEDHYSPAPCDSVVTIHALWSKVNEQLEEACGRLNENLQDNNPALLLELTKRFFRKLKDHVPSRPAT